MLTKSTQLINSSYHKDRKVRYIMVIMGSVPKTRACGQEMRNWYATNIVVSI